MSDAEQSKKSERVSQTQGDLSEVLKKAVEAPAPKAADRNSSNRQPREQGRAPQANTQNHRQHTQTTEPHTQRVEKKPFEVPQQVLEEIFTETL